MSRKWTPPPSDGWKNDASPAKSVGPSANGESSSGERPAPSGGDRLWPTLIIVGMLVVVAVNFAYIWIAVDGADSVVPSYMEEER